MGKSALIFVIGISMLMVYGILIISEKSTSSVENQVGYYGKTMAHNLAVVGANIATSKLRQDPTLSPGPVQSGVQFGPGGGEFTTELTKDAAAGTARIVSRSRFPLNMQGWRFFDSYLRDTVIVNFRFESFSRWGWFTESETNGYKDTLGGVGPYSGQADWKITGDSVYGPAHTNGHFNLAGRPYFHDRVTAGQGPQLMSINGQQAPIFNGGYDWGYQHTRPVTNLNRLRDSMTLGNLLAIPVSNCDIGLEFEGNGSVRVKIPWNTGNILNIHERISDLTSTGVLGVQNGDIHITGEYSGQITVVALKGNPASGGNPNKGNIWIDDNLVAHNSPRGNRTSTDMMGIVAERMAYIRRNDARNGHSVLNVDAAIYCHDGELTAEDFWNLGTSGNPRGHGRVSLYGGVTQKTAGSLGVFDASGILSGFSYSIRYDQRFNLLSPPAFPTTGDYVLVSWWER